MYLRRTEEELFQPALPMRGVTTSEREGSPRATFQPALPMRGVTGADLQLSAAVVDFNPHSPCGE